jgi:hypothetical protein
LNIQGIFIQHSGNIQGTFREHSGNIETWKDDVQVAASDDAVLSRHGAHLAVVVIPQPRLILVHPGSWVHALE